MTHEERLFFEEAPLEKINEWSLVLTALDIPHQIIFLGKKAKLVVPETEIDHAVAQLSLYERENLVAEKRASPGLRKLEPVFWTVLLLTAFLTLPFDPDLRPLLMKYGLGDAHLILRGEWWRLLTALTLHYDPAHLLGNMLFGGIFLGCLRAYWPGGLTWFLTIFSGVLGNLLDSIFRKDHLFLGASTSVFGILGILCALRLLHGERKRLILAFGAGLSLLGLLGTNGERTDLLAHFFGFGAGFFLGLVVEPLRELLEPYDVWIKILCFCFPLLAWFAALYPFNFWQKSSILNY